MAKFQWLSTKHKGLRYRDHENRKHGVKRDRFYQYRQMVKGKRVEESFGWLSEGWTEERCLIEIAKLKQARVTGEGPVTLKEKREKAEAKRKQAERDRITFNEMWSQYIVQAKADRGEKALRIEEGIFKNWIRPAIGEKALRDVAPIHLEKLKSVMAKNGKSPRTIRYILAIIRQVFNYAKRNDMFSGDNPTAKVKKPTTDNRRVRFLSHDEAQSLLNELKTRSDQVYEMTLLSLHTGMRAGEIFCLTWGNVDFNRGIITLLDTKNGKTRSAFMTEAVKDMLIAKSQEGYELKDLVFPGRGGVKRKQMTETFNHAVEKVGLNAGISDPRQKVVFHTLRHTFASWLVENGTDLYTVKELLGHSDFKMTSRYAHLGENSLQAAVKSLEGTLNTKDGVVVSINKTA